MKSICWCVAVLVTGAAAQIPKTFTTSTGWTSALPKSNVINDLLVQQDTIWFATQRGLSETANGGTSWTNFSGTSVFDNKGISAIAVLNNLIWVAVGFDSTISGTSYQTGGGLQYSTDHGITWHHVSQPVDSGKVDTLLYGRNRIQSLNITVPIQNITFDIALTNKAVWIASWAGMLRKSTDSGSTWQRVILPPDNMEYIDTSMSLDFAFNLSPSKKVFTINDTKDTLTENDNHKLFSVCASDDTTIWVGTAGGINKSTDGGSSWRKFSHQNQSQPISGNFVVALKEQRWHNRRIMWAATVNAVSEDETKGISFTRDGGQTWKTTLLGEWAHNIAVKDSLVYVATDNGLFRSSDFGESWIRTGSIYDPTNLQRFVSTECDCVGVQGDTVWIGSVEGIAYTIDSPNQQFGTSWHIFRAAEQVGNNKITYAFPNPFAPSIEPVRLHYSVDAGTSVSQEISIHIFDFAMHPVRTVIQKASRSGGSEYDEIWNGKNDNGSIVPNGVYFYRIEIGNQTPLWGKILVLR